MTQPSDHHCAKNHPARKTDNKKHDHLVQHNANDAILKGSRREEQSLPAPTVSSQKLYLVTIAWMKKKQKPSKTLKKKCCSVHSFRNVTLVLTLLSLNHLSQFPLPRKDWRDVNVHMKMFNYALQDRAFLAQSHPLTSEKSKRFELFIYQINIFPSGMQKTWLQNPSIRKHICHKKTPQ